MPKLNDIKKESDSHKKIYIACIDCGKEKWVTLRIKQPRSIRCQPCGAKYAVAHGNKHHCWKGGRRKTSDGYIEVKLQSDSFFFPMVNSHICILEHRLIMAKYLGRMLQKWEVVHHKNGIKDDNRLDNLELCTSSGHSLAHHKGYRDGYLKGLTDGKNKQITELQQQIKLLQWQMKELLLTKVAA